jgi:diacylglycerol O-acyltransferase / wax synthase
MPTARRLAPADAAFVYGETRETPQHVGTLMRFTPPADAGEDHLRTVLARLRSEVPVAPPWNRRLATPWLPYNPVHSWVPDRSFDFDYHVRRTAVPAPGDERELGILVARLHASPLDLTKPPWELHVIEGLEGGAFAMFAKVHHSLVDGYTMTRALELAFTSEPDSGPGRLLCHVPLDAAGSVPQRLLWADPGSALATSVTDARAVVALTRAFGRLALRRSPLVGSFDAPDSIFNRRITRNRRFATQQYPLDRLKRLARASGTTLNDVALAVCGGGLRTYLRELDELPDLPLVAFVPVNVRPKGDPGGGNAVGGMLASLGTHLADPVERLRAVHASTTHAKQQLEGMTKDAVMAYSQALLAPSALQVLSAVSGMPGGPRRTFNVTISNVPGPARTLWFGGSRLEASYPASIVGHGLALNITLFSYDGKMHLGFTGCRDTVPHLQRLALHTGEAVAELEAALGEGPG